MTQEETIFWPGHCTNEPSLHLASMRFASLVSVFNAPFYCSFQSFLNVAFQGSQITNNLLLLPTCTQFQPTHKQYLQQDEWPLPFATGISKTYTCTYCHSRTNSIKIFMCKICSLQTLNSHSNAYHAHWKYFACLISVFCGDYKNFLTAKISVNYSTRKCTTAPNK